MRAVILLSLSLAIWLTLPVAGAEIYTWVDANGKKHFSDTPPAESAEDGSDVDREEFELHNIDFGYPPGIVVNPARDQGKANRKRTSARAQQADEACRKARADLRILAGRVVFTNADGVEIKVPEQERQAMEKALRSAIQTECRD